MRENVTRSALLVIDMEQGFIDPASPLCIPMAAATVPAVARAVETARKKAIPVFFVKRLYRPDGSDVELTRWEGWRSVGRGMGPGSAGRLSGQAPEGLRPQPGDYTIIKPRWSSFYQTELDLILRRLEIRTVILTGTTTPNCIRTTAYDAVALDYNVVVLSDCTSSRTEAVQRANLEDMACVGMHIMTGAEFENYDEHTIADPRPAILADRLAAGLDPEAFEPAPEGGVNAVDRW